MSKKSKQIYSSNMNGNIIKKGLGPLRYLQTNRKLESKICLTTLLPQEYPLPVNIIKQPELLLPYKCYVKKQNQERFLKQLHVMIHKRYKLHNVPMSKTLRKMEDIVDPVHAVTDFDKEFFIIVNGRPLPHYIPLFKSLKCLLNSRLRIRQENGYKEDSFLNIEINFRLEKRIYDLSLQRLNEQVNSFDKFIMEDYVMSMKLLEKGEKMNTSLDAQITELQNLADESFTIMSRLIGLDYKYGLQQKYGRFLYYLSPSSWRSKNREFARSIEIEAKGFDFGSSNEEDTFTVIFEKLRKECLSSLVKPVLYFSSPHELVDVFVGMEKQQLYHFSRGMQLVPHIKSLKDGIQMLKEKNAQDSAVLVASIEKFKNLLTFCEDRSVQLKEQFFKILNGFFYECVGTLDVLKLFLHLEFCYEKVFLESPMNMDMFTIAKAIESMYMDYTKRLDGIKSDTVRKAVKKSMDVENKKLHKAKCATKELRLFYRLEQELLRAHTLPLPKEKVRSYGIHEQKLLSIHSKSRSRNQNRQSLTDAEIEYLTLFTDWTINEDPLLYLQSHSTEYVGATK